MGSARGEASIIHACNERRREEVTTRVIIFSAVHRLLLRRLSCVLIVARSKCRIVAIGVALNSGSNTTEKKGKKEARLGFPFIRNPAYRGKVHNVEKGRGRTRRFQIRFIFNS